jgi:GrpB-like predicted nucleotidyltransferase (UPF0157 family)
MAVERDLYGLGLEQGVNRLVDYNPLWPRAFAEEAARIRSAIGPLARAIEHYGSTAVPNLRAKPIIDFLIGVEDIDHGLQMIEPMMSLGYDYAGNQGIPGHHIFGRGAARTHLAHIVVHGGGPWVASLAFRDRLRTDADLRAEYQALKERLAAKATSRAEYTAGKSEFVEAHNGQE